MHHCCYCVSKLMTKEALQNHCMRNITRARLTVCEVAVFSGEISQLENMPTPLFQEPPKFIPHGRIFERLW